MLGPLRELWEWKIPAQQLAAFPSPTKSDLTKTNNNLN